MNIGAADDQSEQRFCLFENGCDFCGETPEKRFANRAGSVHVERDTPRARGSCGALERRVALVP
jgi:hypothetical protein